MLSVTQGHDQREYFKDEKSSGWWFFSYLSPHMLVHFTATFLPSSTQMQHKFSWVKRGIRR